MIDYFKIKDLQDQHEYCIIKFNFNYFLIGKEVNITDQLYSIARGMKLHIANETKVKDRLTYEFVPGNYEFDSSFITNVIIKGRSNSTLPLDFLINQEMMYHYTENKSSPYKAITVYLPVSFLTANVTSMDESVLEAMNDQFLENIKEFYKKREL